jgi:hypothetical protein
MLRLIGRILWHRRAGLVTNGSGGRLLISERFPDSLFGEKPDIGACLFYYLMLNMNLSIMKPEGVRQGQGRQAENMRSLRARQINCQ